MDQAGACVDQSFTATGREWDDGNCLRFLPNDDGTDNKL